MNQTKKPRVAICISGKLRYWKQAYKSWKVELLAHTLTYTHHAHILKHSPTEREGENERREEATPDIAIEPSHTYRHSYLFDLWKHNTTFDVFIYSPLDVDEPGMCGVSGQDRGIRAEGEERK